MTPPNAPAPPAERLPRGRRYAIRGLLALATILAVAAIFAVWANRQVLDADNWADTSTALLEDQHVRTGVANFLVDGVYANVDVSAQLAAALPPRLRPLAGPAAGGLRNLAQQAAGELLGRPRVQEAWRSANRLAAQQFINLAEGNAKALTRSGDAVVLDLRVLLVDLVQRLGLPGTVAGRIPPGAARIKIVSADQLTVVQDGADALRGLAVVLPVAVVALFALAAFLAQARRRRTLLTVGVDLVFAGALVLVARGLIGNQVVAGVAKTAAVKPAAEATWSIGTRMLRDVAQATIVIGIPLIAAAWLAGPMRSAYALRRAAAPWLRERPGVVYGVVALLVLVVVAWGPIPATRMVVPVLLLIALVLLGVEALRRQAALEFPGATVDDTRASLHAAAARLGGALRGRGRPAVTAHDDNGARHEGDGADDRLARLERLSALHDSGAISDDEFAAEKAALPTGTATA
ncbi:MAG: hypothetical protein JWQ48_1391 [Conexibacter sp.]|nr:hypothetical protein [Conexibacter sp.]